MIETYPHSSPIILTDEVWYDHGGDPSISQSEVLRDSAYLVAEKRMTRFLGTFLLPTIVTGTYPVSYQTLKNGLYLRYGRVDQVYQIEYIDEKEDVYYTISGTANLYASLKDSERGIVDLHSLHGSCCGSLVPYPYEIRIAYRAGLPTGTASAGDFLVSLSIIAKITLNEMVGFGNETVGDAQITSFRNIDYSEDRDKHAPTALGRSAQARYAADLVKNLRIRRGPVI